MHTLALNFKTVSLQECLSTKRFPSVKQELFLLTIWETEILISAPAYDFGYLTFGIQVILISEVYGGIAGCSFCHVLAIGPHC